MTDVSIIIVNYNTLAMINDCIRSIVRHTRNIGYEIIVVDNHSDDNLADDLIHPQGCDVRALSLDENVGFGRACNAGTDIATGRNLFYLNPDTILLNNAVAILSDYLDNHPDTGVVGGNLFDREMKPTLSFRRMIPGLAWEINEFFNTRLEPMFHHGSINFNQTGDPLTVSYITGADMMIKRKVFDQTGGFRPEFFMYYEESDLCRRIGKLGWQIMSVPSAKIQHLEGGSKETQQNTLINRNHIERVEKGRRTYYRLNFNPVMRVVISGVYLATLLTRSALVRNPRRKAEWRHRLKTFFRH